MSDNTALPASTLVRFEWRVLEMCAGEQRWQSGGAINQALEVLRACRFIDDRLDLTDAGRAALNSKAQ